MTRAAPGRPRTTSREEVQRVALQLFADRGFEEATLDDIAAAVGVSRRTLFRYYPSKNDIVWGEFSEHLAGLRERLTAARRDEPLIEVLRAAVVAFNDYGDEEMPGLRIRMTLITSVPALQGHSMVRYRDWCDVIAEFVAMRLGCERDDHVPEVIANAALGTAMATYRHWITHPDVNLLDALDKAFRLLAAGFDESALRASA
jgi:TetR/AcrR family transcriptional regulator, regulator of mycofactocin system